MRRALLIVFAFSLIGCVDPYQDEEFLPFIIEFQQEYNTTIDFPVVFHASENESWAGQCKIAPGTKRVFVDPEDWAQISSVYVQRAFIFHELAHCAFWLKHEEGKFHTNILKPQEGKPLSYMWPGNSEQVPAFHDPELVDYYTEELRDRIYFVGKASVWDARGP